MEKTDNELIAEFMGWKRISNEYSMISFMVPNTYPWDFPDAGETQCTPDAMSFHDRWDWLMPVIERICNLWRENVDQHNTPPPEQREWDRRGSKVGMLSIDCGIKAAYINVVEFIKWYNQQKQ